jgi:hypothetical protein
MFNNYEGDLAPHRLFETMFYPYKESLIPPAKGGFIAKNQ